MYDQFSNAQQIRKPAVVSQGGIVAAQSRKAAEVGAKVLAAEGRLRRCRYRNDFRLGGAGALDERRRGRRGHGALSRPRGPS